MLDRPDKERFFESTRGRVATLLRRGPMTTEELAKALGLTDNAVRAHLATLERDGLVKAEGVRHEGRVGKPATLYRLSPEVEPLFSKAYRPLLTTLLGTLGERLPEQELTGLLRELGRATHRGSGGASAARVQRAESAWRAHDGGNGRGGGPLSHPGLRLPHRDRRERAARGVSRHRGSHRGADGGGSPLLLPAR